jgi:hypothetical protein
MQSIGWPASPASRQRALSHPKGRPGGTQALWPQNPASRPKAGLSRESTARPIPSQRPAWQNPSVMAPESSRQPIGRPLPRTHGAPHSIPKAGLAEPRLYSPRIQPAAQRPAVRTCTRRYPTICKAGPRSKSQRRRRDKKPTLPEQARPRLPLAIRKAAISCNARAYSRSRTPPFQETGRRPYFPSGRPCGPTAASTSMSGKGGGPSSRKSP